MERELRVVGKLARTGPPARGASRGRRGGPLGVVLVAHRRSEQGEQRVTRELLDVSLVSPDDAAQPADHRVDHLEELLGVEPIGQRREPGNVREQGSDEPPFLGKLTAASRSRSATGCATKLRSVSETSGEVPSTRPRHNVHQNRVPSGFSPLHDEHTQAAMWPVLGTDAFADLVAARSRAAVPLRCLVQQGQQDHVEA